MEVRMSHCSKIIRKDKVLENISLEFISGKVYGLRGVNGSGKTMLLRLLCGLIYASEGEVVIDGQVLGKDISFPPSVGVLIENPGFLPEFSGYDNLYAISQIKKKIGRNEIEAIMREFDLDPGERKHYRKFSLGMKQKLGLCAAFMEQPDMILLDEPTNALDEHSVMVLKQEIERQKERGTLIVLASHDRETLNMLADEMIEIENGKIRGAEVHDQKEKK